MTGNVTNVMARENLADLLKYALIVASTVPLLLVYPFVQKHFVKGALLGSLKG
jgi:ABC-type glycerol-3-phosphate transport system permease component